MSTHMGAGAIVLHWCQARRCTRRVNPGTLMCGRHLELVPRDLRHALTRVDHRGLIFAAANLDTLGRLELVAAAIAAVARAEGAPEWSEYHARAELVRRALAARGEAEGGGGAC